MRICKVSVNRNREYNKQVHCKIKQRCNTSLGGNLIIQRFTNPTIHSWVKSTSLLSDYNRGLVDIGNWPVDLNLYNLNNNVFWFDAVAEGVFKL